ncbi:TapB family protein [Emticicia agri]|uniref:DUF3108 domain-containing protein n=1 Tax=Emticicia agri TaxID=2492393 RepID=A0A4Q5M3A9_9BACT|nr:hypothetical protein [Emticicia agri]RYU96337.1 hypothetical protein EWM59_07440 [Emticicia agri]
MKKTLSLLFAFAMLFHSYLLTAQDCGGYFAFKKGMKVEMTSYDKKDKPTVTTKYEVIDYKPIDGGISMAFAHEAYDAKGKLLSKSESTGKCVGGDYYTDIRNITSDAMPKSPDMKVTVTGDQMVYPRDLKVGDILKDASINVKTGFEGGMTLMNMNANITNRKVEAYETIETPAGKFECAKITYTMNMKFMGNRTLKCVEYLAKGVGMVKTEQFDEKGNRQAYMVVTKIEGQ